MTIINWIVWNLLGLISGYVFGLFFLSLYYQKDVLDYFKRRRK
jgi:hypothetical protein